jgi:hypothetical protein
MVTISYSGRLGNNLFQYIAAYIFAKKFNLKISSDIVANNFNLPLLESGIVGDTKIDVDDSNFMCLLESDSLELAHYHFVGYYQIKEFILKYRHEIKSLFKLDYDNQDSDEVFISYRIGDLNGLRLMLPIEYYQDALSKLNFNKGYITSDSPDHPNVINLMREFNLEIYDASPLDTINFAKNFNNLILSEGSFSWWMGFLSKAENIYYNERSRFWHGDIFVLPEWKALKYDWSPECFNSNNQLKCDRIVKKI